MSTGSVTGGRGVTGLMVWGPAPAILNWITSGTLALPLAERMACRSEPPPVSLVVLTTRVAPHPGPAPAAPSNIITKHARRPKLLRRCVFIAVNFSFLSGARHITHVSSISFIPVACIPVTDFAGRGDEVKFQRTPIARLSMNRSAALRAGAFDRSKYTGRAGGRRSVPTPRSWSQRQTVLVSLRAGK